MIWDWSNWKDKENRICLYANHTSNPLSIRCFHHYCRDCFAVQSQFKYSAKRSSEFLWNHYALYWFHHSQFLTLIWQQKMTSWLGTIRPFAGIFLEEGLSLRIHRGLPSLSLSSPTREGSIRSKGVRSHPQLPLATGQLKMSFSKEEVYKKYDKINAKQIPILYVPTYFSYNR